MMKHEISRRNLMALLFSAASGSACKKREAPGQVGSSVGAAKPDRPASGTPGVTADTIKVGSWGPLSGPAAQWSTVFKGMEAYFAFINDKGGIHGRKIEFIYRDDQYSPAKTPAVVRELVEKENVFAIVGGIGTANGRSVADYLEEKGVPLFTPASGDRFWSEGGKKNVYTVFPKYATEGEIIGDYVGKELKAKRVGVLYQDDEFGKQGLEGVEKGLEKQRASKLVVKVTCQPTDTDLSGQVSQIVESAPQVLIIYAAPKQAVMAVKSLDAQRKKPQIVTSFVLSDPILLKLGGESWNGTITGAASKLTDSDDPAIANYRQILAKYGGEKLPVGTFTLSGFLYGIPFTEALQRAGKDLTRAGLYKALESLDNWNEGGPYWTGGALGPAISFGGRSRLGVNQIYFAKAKAGKWEKLTEWLSAGS